jgi:hypothetical protein
MPTVSPATNLPLKGFYESSVLRPSRDSGDVRQAWKKSKEMLEQIRSLVNEAELELRKLERMRRRILGGSGSTSSTGGFAGEWDPNRAYTAGQIVVITSGSNAGAYGCNQSNTGQAPYAGGGYWTAFPAGTLGSWM